MLEPGGCLLCSVPFSAWSEKTNGTPIFVGRPLYFANPHGSVSDCGTHLWMALKGKQKEANRLEVLIFKNKRT